MVKAQAMEALTKALGKENVITEAEDLLCYSFDATADMPSQVPDVVVVPQNINQVVEVIKVAREFKLPIYPRGSGTNLSGGTIPLQGGIVLSMKGMDKIVEIDADNLVAVVQPGVVIQDLNNAVAPLA
ncbi:hypothetical protein N752_18565 [Desulforamulus aquiferis]|nr:hypothetical protein N752_18565 [Desulforamulus aquiferis]